MHDIARKILADLKARQAAGEVMPCPRCGKDTMNQVMGNNPESRREPGLRICKLCEKQEIGLEQMNNPGAFPLYSWAAFKPDPAKGDFKAMTAEAAEKYIEDHYIRYLTDLYTRLGSSKESRDDLLFEAQHTCPGLNEIWDDPLRADFRVLGGYVSVQFRERDGEVQHSFWFHPDIPDR